MLDKREQLYKNLIQTGKVNESHIGNIDQFRSVVRDEGSSRTLYENLTKLGLSSDEIGDADTFYSSIASDFPGAPPVSADQKKTSGASDFSWRETSGIPSSVLPESPDETIVPPETIRGFGSAFKQGMEGLYEGGKFATGEMAGLLSGSQREYSKALEQLDEFQKNQYPLEGFDTEKALKWHKDKEYNQKLEQYKSDKKEWKEGFGERSGWDYVKHIFDYPERPASPYDTGLVAADKYSVGDEVELKRAYGAIGEALKESGGDVNAAKKILSDKAGKEQWSDKARREAGYAFDKFKPTEGFAAWAGALAPQMIGSTIAVGASVSPYTRFLARPLAAANMAALSASSGGSAMADARKYGASSGDVLRSGVLSAGLEWATEKIPFDRYFGRLQNYTRKKLGKEVVSRVAESGTAKKELSDLLKKAGKELPGKFFSKKGALAFGGDVFWEGLSEFVAEGGGAMIPMIYANEEDYPTLKGVLEQGWEGAKAGFFMGGILGGASNTVGYYTNRNRRKEQGKVALADIDGKVVEVVGQNGNTYSVLDGDGRVSDVSRDDVKDYAVVGFDEFDGYARRQTEENLEKAVESGRRIDFDDSMEVYQHVASGIDSELRMELMDVANTGEYLASNPDKANVAESFFTVRSQAIGSALSLFEGRRNKKSRNVVTGHDVDGNPVYVLDETGEGCLVLYQDGSKKFIPVPELRDLSELSVGDFAREFVDKIPIAQTGMSSGPVVGKSASLNGEAIKIQRIEEDGSVIIEKEGGGVDRVSGDALVYENQGMPDNGVNVALAEVDGVEAQAQKEVQPEKQIPVTKDGKPDYNAMLENDPELFASEWEKRSNPQDTENRLAGVSDKISGRIESLTKKSEAETDFNKIGDIEDEILRLKAQKERIDGVVSQRYAKEVKKSVQEQPVFSNEEEISRWVSENSGDVNEILGTYEAVKGLRNDAANSLPRWQQELLGRKVKPDSFYENGDRNHVTPELKRGWLSKDGRSVDELAHDLSAFGVEVSNQDVVDFMMDHPSGKIRMSNEEVDALGQRFSEVAMKMAGMKIGRPDSPTGKLFIEKLKTSENAEQLKQQIESAQQAETEVLRSMAEQNEAEQMNSEAVEPIGKGFFGNIYDQFRGKAKEAIDFLLHQKSGEALGALHHPEVGDIDLVWGNEKAGLMKIARKHPEVLGNLQEEIDQMDVVSFSDNRVVLESPSHKAIVSKNVFDETDKQWLLTAYEKKNAIIPDSSIDIESEPEGKQNGTAPLQNNSISSTNKDTEFPGKNQEFDEDNGYYKPLTDEEVGVLMARMQDDAVEVPVLELTPENWTNEFGEDGMVDTPVGKVKMGENQYLKFAKLGRGAQLGMVKPTLTNPDVVIEDKSGGVDSERSSSYVYVKTFTDKSGKKHTYFTSVTVLKDGMEVSVSSHIKNKNRIKSLLKEGNLLWNRFGFDSDASGEHQDYTTSTTLNPSDGERGTKSQSKLLSTNKDTEFPGKNQESDTEIKRARVLHFDGKEYSGDVVNDSKRFAPSRASIDIANAEAAVNTSPTEAQKEAGNYRMGHVKINGFDVTIEQPKGSVRSGVDKDGKEWSQPMNHTYGYFKGTKGKDGDHIDVFVGPDPNSERVFVVDQVNRDGSFDEHKVMMGFDSIEDARKAYLSNYESEWQGLGGITGVGVEEFREWADSGTKRIKPFAEYKTVKDVPTTEEQAEIDAEMRRQEEYGDDGEIRYRAVYHGSPHSFDQFSVEKINTGEGARAFGWGLYFTEKEDVAKWYADRLAQGGVSMTSSGLGRPEFEAITRINDAYEYDKRIKTFDSAKSKAKKELSETIEKADRDFKGTGFYASKTVLDFFKQTYDYLETVDEANYKDPKLRNLYNAEIPDGGFLNWDKQLADSQKKQISEQAEQEGVSFSFYGDKVSPAEYFRKAADAEGFQVYKMLSDVLHGDKEASMFLNRAGLNGIEFVAQRHTTANKTGAMNYVVFDDKAVEMIDHVRYRNENTPAEVNARFNEELQQQIDGKLPKGHVYQLGKPSGALRSAGIPDLPIEMSADRLFVKSEQDNHPFDLRNVVNLPDATQNPIAVFDSKTQSDSKVILTELSDGEKNFVVAIKAQRHRVSGRSVLYVNEIRSLYPKDIKQLIKWIESGHLLRVVDKEKTINWLGKQQSNSADVAIPNDSLNSITNIIKNFENPSVLEGEILAEVESLSKDLNTPVRIIRDVNDMTDEDLRNQNKKRGSQGWFDPKTGEVVVVLPNMVDVEDAQRTMLHEVLGHKGIHGLFGGKLPDFCRRVLDSMDKDARVKLIEKHGGNEQLAAEEYVAGFAEGYSDPTAWERVKAIVMEMLRELGIDLRLSDNDLKYVLWRAKNRLREGDGVFDVARKMAKDREMKDVLFRKMPEELNSSEEFIKQKRGEIGTARERLVDMSHSVKELGDFLRSKGGKVRDFEDAYSESLLSESKSHHAIKRYQQDVQSPLNEAIVTVMQSSGATFDEVCGYVMAKHAPERNREIGRRKYEEWLKNAEYQFFSNHGKKDDIDFEKKRDDFEKRKRDKDHEFNSVVYAGMSNDEAEGIVTAFEGKCRKDNIRALWSRINTATKFALEVEYKNGFISKGLFDHLNGMFKYYVPLKGWEETDGVDYSQSERYSTHPGKVKKAEGRQTKADNPFSYIEMAAEGAILKGNRNYVRQCLYNMCVNNPNKGLYTISKTYYVEKDGEWVATNEHPDESLFAAGKAKTELVDTPHKDFVKSSDAKRYEVDVWIGGEKRTITFAQGEKGLDIADAINREKVVRPGRVSDAFGKATRYLSSINTSKNPEFVLRNFERDFLYAVPAYAIKGGNSFKLMGNLPRAFKALNAEFVKGSEKADTELNRYMDEYLSGGGKTGFIHSLDIESRKQNARREINRMMNSGTKSGKARAVGRAINKTMEYFSDMSENSIRFAVFITEREKGKSVKEAAISAKEITVNFNRKGTLTPVLGSYFAFFNASVQGSLYNFVGLGVKWTNRFIVANAALGVIQILSASLSRCFGDEDELGVSDYDRLSDHTRNNNIILPDILRLGELFGWQNQEGRKYGFMTIPMPQSFRAVSSVGIIADQVLRGRKDVSKGMLEVVDNVVANMSPLDLEFYNFSTGNPAMFLARGLPTVAQPFVDIVANKDFADRQIYKKEFMKNWEGKVPESSLGLSRTNGLFTAMAQWGNRVANGTINMNPELQVADDGGVSRNKFMSWLDWNPAVMEHVVEGITGGRGRFWNNVYKTVEAGLTDKEVNHGDIPFVRTHRTMPYRKTHWEMFFDVRDQVGDVDFVAGINKKAGNYGTHVRVLTKSDQLDNAISFDYINKLVSFYRTMANMAKTDEVRESFLDHADQAVLNWAKGRKKAKEAGQMKKSVVAD